MITLSANPGALLCPTVSPYPPGVPVTIATPDGVIGCWLRSGSRFIGVAKPFNVTVADEAELRGDLLFGSFRTNAERAATDAATAADTLRRAKKVARTQAVRDIKTRIKAIAAGSRTQTEKDLLDVAKLLLSED